MTGLASSRRIVRFVAIEADSHRRDAGRFGHLLHLCDLSMTRLAFDSGIEVFAMRPSNTREYVVDAHPRDGLARF